MLLNFTASKTIVSKTFFSLFLLAFYWSNIVWAIGSTDNNSKNNQLDQKISRYVKHGTVLVGNEEQILYRYSSTEESILPPASVLKLLTASAALHRLGPNYQYKTSFYLNNKHDLIIEGSGDPFLVSEEWTKIAQQLKKELEKRKIKKIRSIVLDTTLFDPDIIIPGLEATLNPYDARNGALVANFNTVNVRVQPDLSVISAEKQTPLTPLAEKSGKGLSVGRHRINFSQDPQMILAYVAELFQVFLEQHDIEVQEGWSQGVRDLSSSPIYTHKNSKTLQEVIAGMMLYSNNFIANQLMLTLGVKQYGAPATLEKGVKALNSFLKDDMKLDPALFHLVEGSGISRDNRIAPEVLLVLLRNFYPYRHLLPQKEGLWVKTGTLRGVYSLEGYLPRPEPKKPLYFVIMLQQKKNFRNQIFTHLVQYAAKL